MDKKFFDKCKEKLGRITDSMIYTNQAFLVIMQLRDFQEKNNELINISPAFYSCVYECTMEYLFIEIDKMFDPKIDRDGMYGLLNKLKNKIHLLDRNRPFESNVTHSLNSDIMTSRRYTGIDALVDESIELIESVKTKEITKNVKTLRDKYFAHREEKKDFSPIFKAHPVSLKDIEALLVLNANIVNALYMYFKEKTIVPRTTDYNDFGKTVFYIQKGIDAIREQEG